MVAGIIGEVEAGEDGKNDYYLWTHKKLDIGYNGETVRERGRVSTAECLSTTDSGCQSD